MPNIISSSITNLTINSNSSDHTGCFSKLGDKGKDLSDIYTKYNSIKKTELLADYSDVVKLCREKIEQSTLIENSTFIIFPHIGDELSFRENECLDIILNSSDTKILIAGKNSNTQVDFFTAPYDTLEIAVTAETKLVELLDQSS